MIFQLDFTQLIGMEKMHLATKLANGVYLYQLKAKGDDETASFIGRLAKYE